MILSVGSFAYHLHPSKKWTRPTSLPATPQLMNSATLRAHFEKYTKLTPLEKNGLSLINMQLICQVGKFFEMCAECGRVH